VNCHSDIFVSFLSLGLNTCIGRANYESFFRTLQSLFAMELVHSISQIYLIIDFFHGDYFGDTQTRIRQIYPKMSIYAPLGVWIAFLSFNVLALILLGQLYVFHSVLQSRNLTTYEHILQEFRAQRSLARRMGDVEAIRMESITRAQGQKDSVRVFRLRCGGFCRQIGCAYLDPLKLAPEPEEPDPEAGFANALGGDYVEDLNQTNDDENEKVNGATVDDDELVPDATYVPNGDKAERDAINARTPNDHKASDQREASESHDITPEELSPTEFVETSNGGDGALGVVDSDAEYDNYLEHENVGVDVDDDDDDGTEDEFIDEPDDLSARSGCSGRSYRSGRSGRSSKSGRSRRLGGERDLTSF
jgi:DHHC palmitoyltransferase